MSGEAKMAKPALLFSHTRGRWRLPVCAVDGLKIRCSRERGETRSKRAEKRAKQKRCGGLARRTASNPVQQDRQISLGTLC